MNPEGESPFDSIESAHSFIGLLSEAVAEAKQEIDTDIQRELNANSPRRLEALQVAVYCLEKLRLNMDRSGRILNDLRSLRRLLFQERNARALAAQPLSLPGEKAVVAIADISLRPVSSLSQPGKRGSAAA